MRVLVPSPEAIARATGIAGPLATLRAVRPLLGGTHADTYLIQITNPDLELVLCEFPAGDDAPSNAALVLTALEGLGGMAPRLLAGNVDGIQSERPWLLLSRLPGVADIAPGDPGDCAVQLGRALARIHRAPLSALAYFQSVFERDGGSVRILGGPAATTVAERWEDLQAATNVLTHYDFWSGNVVWQHGLLSGVVDWSGAGVGPAGFDLGWCRLDLYLLYGEEIADVFLQTYQAATGSRVPYGAISDLWAVARSYATVEDWDENYRALGRLELTKAELRRRHTEWTTSLLESIA